MSTKRHKHVRHLGRPNTGKRRRGTGNYWITGWQYHPTKGFRKATAPQINLSAPSLLALLS